MHSNCEHAVTEQALRYLCGRTTGVGTALCRSSRRIGHHTTGGTCTTCRRRRRDTLQAQSHKHTSTTHTAGEWQDMWGCVHRSGDYGTHSPQCAAQVCLLSSWTEVARQLSLVSLTQLPLKCCSLQMQMQMQMQTCLPAALKTSRHRDIDEKARNQAMPDQTTQVHTCASRNGKTNNRRSPQNKMKSW